MNYVANLVLAVFTDLVFLPCSLTLWSVVVKITNGFTNIMFIFNIFGGVWCSPLGNMVYIFHLRSAEGQDENSNFLDLFHIFYC